MASKKSAPGFLCLAFFIFSCFLHEGTALYFSQNTLTLNRSYVVENATIYTTQSILEPDDIGDISYRITPNPTKQTCPRLSIHPTLGSIYATVIPKEFQNATCKFTITSQLNGTAGMRDMTTDTLELTMKSVKKASEENVESDCSQLPLEILCFDGLSNLDLQVMENSEPTKAIALGNTMHSCQKKSSVQYYLDSVGEDVMSIREDNSTGSSVWIKTTLDREATSIYNFSITCLVSGESSEANKNITIPGSLTVLDQDDNPPESQKGTRHVTIYIDLRQNNDVTEGDRLNTLDASDLLIIDRDTVEVNNYETIGLNDTKGILNFEVQKYSGGHTKTKSTAVLLKIILNKKLKDVKTWEDLYCVAVVMNDTTLVKKIENAEMRYTVCLHWGHWTPQEPKADLTDEELKSLLSNGIYETRFPRKSSMHALVMYPFPDLIRDISEVAFLPNLDFRIEKFKLFSHDNEDLAPNVYFGAEEQTNSPFSVTARTGIIYATNPSFLRDSSMKHISLRLTWKIPTNSSSQVDNRSYGANVTIFLDGDVHEIGKNGTVPCDIESCAEFSESHKCESSCGFGSLKNCVWIPRQSPIEQNSIAAPSNTTINSLDYATCTAAIETCPDGRCDELESMQPFRCPQDCATEINGLSRLRQRVNGKRHGIESGTGVCSCHSKTSCSCAHLPPSQVKPVTPISPDAPSTSGTSAEPSPRHFISTSYTEQPKSGPIQTAEGECGQTCIFFLVALVLFLLSIVIFTVYVYKARKSTRRKARNVKPNMSINPSGMVVSGMYGHGLPMDNGNNINDPDYIRAGMESDTYHGRTNAHYGCGDYLMVDTKWEIPRNCLLLEQVLGEGEFGRVLKGKAHNLPNHEGTLDVAVKMLKDHNSENGKSCRQEFMAEFSLLQQVDHPNVIKLLGACTSPGGPPFLVMEYAEMGSLRSFLRKCRRVESVSSGSSGIVWSGPQSPSNTVLTFHPTPAEQQDAYLRDTQYIVTPQEVLGFSWQIAKGMAYLSDMKMVHRDLAARNILLTKGKVCKISDFGLTRDIYVDDAYKKKSKDRVPVKWLALECLADELYTTKSDVWAFGILLWELATLGASPYPGIQNEQLYPLLKSGYRMQQPINCSAELYELMLHCWAGEVANRPNFHQLVNAISKLLEDGIEYLKLDIPSVSNPGYDFFLQEEKPAELKEVTVDTQIAQAGQPKVGADGSMENLRLIDHEISTNEDFESNSTGYNNFVHTYINEPKPTIRESRRKIPVNSGYESPIKVVTPISKE